MIVVMTVITGLIYPLGMTGCPARLPASGQRQPDREGRQGRRLGADRPEFTDDKYSTAGPRRPPTPTRTIRQRRSRALQRRQFGRLQPRPDEPGADRPRQGRRRKAQGGKPVAPIPVDLVTTSASGLDPDITPAAAEFQVPRVAKARDLRRTGCGRWSPANIEDRFLGILGEKRVNVLKLNFALDQCIEIGLTSTRRERLNDWRDGRKREGRPSPDALLAAAGRESRGPAEDFPRRRAGGRQDLRDAAGRPAPAARGRRCRRRRGRDPRPDARPRRCSKASRSSRGGRSNTTASGSTKWISTRSSRAARSWSLVDELAHTNAPGSRHPKRYLDVEELLAAGIDVYTTLNIQHVESLNDVVARITRIRVRETVPDSDPRPGRRHRGRRSHARGTDPAAARGQGLCAAAGRARDPPLLLARQSDRVARAGAAPHRRSASTTRCCRICGRMRSPAVGGGRAHPRLRQRGAEHRRA